MAKRYNMTMLTSVLPGLFQERKVFKDKSIKDCENLIKQKHPNDKVSWEEGKASLVFQPTLTTMYRLSPVREDLPVLIQPRVSLREWNLAY